MNCGAKLIVGLLLVGAIGSPLQADETAGKAEKETKAKQTKREKLYERFQKKMSGVRLKGRFTVLGRMDKPPSEEEYIIKKVERVPDTKDLWAFTASMKYNNKKRSFVVPIPVKWADDTPVISMSNLTLPGLGTFSCRVVIYNNKYAGTWKHGKVGGHMIGVVEPLETEQPEEEKREP